MKKMMMCAAVLIALPYAAFAEHDMAGMEGMSHEGHEMPAAEAPAAKAEGQVIHVGVNGMVCDFCAQSLTKVFKKNEGVSNVDVSLEKKLITITLKKDGKIEDETIKKLVVDAGYAIEGIHRMPVEKTAAK